MTTASIGIADAEEGRLARTSAVTIERIAAMSSIELCAALSLDRRRDAVAFIDSILRMGQPESRSQALVEMLCEQLVAI